MRRKVNNCCGPTIYTPNLRIARLQKNHALISLLSAVQTPYRGLPCTVSYPLLKRSLPQRNLGSVRNFFQRIGLSQRGTLWLGFIGGDLVLSLRRAKNHGFWWGVGTGRKNVFKPKCVLDWF